MSSFSPLQIAVAIASAEYPWYICKWFESIDETSEPGRYIASNGNLTLFQAAELTYLDDARLVAAPYGVFYKNIHPSGLVVEISKFPAYLRQQACGPDRKSYLRKGLELFGL